MLLFVGSLKATTIAHVAIIYATVPFAAAALGWLVLRENPGRVALLASGLALAGSAVMVGVGGDGQPLGDLMALGMVAAMAARARYFFMVVCVVRLEGGVRITACRSARGR